jgi:nucleotide-binding universal stress UspA family protein
MYSKILVPVDLEHAESLEKALNTAADLAGHYGASVCLLGVTASAPSAVAHTPEEFAGKLDTFASEQGARHGASFATKTVVSHDPAVDLDKTLEATAEEMGADLIVMASHIPGFADHFIASNAGHVASHSKMSVLVVR